MFAKKENENTAWLTVFPRSASREFRHVSLGKCPVSILHKSTAGRDKPLHYGYITETRLFKYIWNISPRKKLKIFR